MTDTGSTDSKLLLAGLIEYRKSLESHLNKLGSQYIQLENRWRTFNAVSEGNYAEQFRAGWTQTDARFQTYLAQSDKIKSFLNERIEFLARVNGENPELYISSPANSSRNGGSTSSETIASEPKIKGNSKYLRDNLGGITENKIPGTDKLYPPGKYQAHHVIPVDSANKSPLVRTAIERFGFDIDSAINGIYLPTNETQQSVVKNMTGVDLPKHSGYHSRYSSMINDILEVHWQDINGKDHLSEFFIHESSTQSDQIILNTLHTAIDIIKNLIVDGTLDTEDMYKNRKKS